MTPAGSAFPYSLLSDGRLLHRYPFAFMAHFRLEKNRKPDNSRAG